MFLYFSACRIITPHRHGAKFSFVICAISNHRVEPARNRIHRFRNHPQQRPRRGEPPRLADFPLRRQGQPVPFAGVLIAASANLAHMGAWACSDAQNAQPTALRGFAAFGTIVLQLSSSFESSAKFRSQPPEIRDVNITVYGNP
jgi:hypothetical protein